MNKRDIYADIRNNKWKSFGLMILFSFIIILLGWVFGEYFFGHYSIGMILAFLFAIIYSLIMWNKGDATILKSARAQKVTREQDPQLHNVVEELCIPADIPKPQIYIIDDPSLNAFATGKDPAHASVAITSGLRNKLSRQELEGVIAHELSHIKNYDIRFSMMIVIFLGIVLLLSDIMIRSFLFGGGRRDSKDAGWLIIVALALAILAPLIAQLIRFSISRKREYLADADGAYLTGYPRGLADALKKIKEDVTEPKKTTLNRATSHLYINEPNKKRRSLKSLFATHPPIDERIKRLEAM